MGKCRTNENLLQNYNRHEPLPNNVTVCPILIQYTTLENLDNVNFNNYMIEHFLCLLFLFFLVGMSVATVITVLNNHLITS